MLAYNVVLLTGEIAHDYSEMYMLFVPSLI